MHDMRCPVVVGRDRELDELVARLEDRSGGVVFVLGEAGIGKSRLAAAFADVARSRGATIARGRAASSPAPAPYRALTEALLSGFGRRHRPSSEDLGTHATGVAALVPGWADPGGSAPAEPSLILLGEALLALLDRLADPDGAVVVLEDLHWADPETLEVLEYVVDKLEDLPVVVVVTIRTGEGSAGERLAHDLAARRIARLLELHRLDDRAVDEMVRTALGAASVPADVTDAVFAATGGVPLFVEEVVASLAARGQLVPRDGSWHIEGAPAPVPSASFAASVRARLEQLDAEDRRTVALAALVGTVFDWELVTAASGREPSEVSSALRTATSLQLIHVDAAGRFCFRHALTRTAVLESLLPPERTALARAALETAASMSGGWERTEVAAGLAEAAGDPEQAASLLLDAAAGALARGAVGSARRAAERASLLPAGVDLLVQADELLLAASVLAGATGDVVSIGERLLSRLEAAEAPPGRRSAVHVRLARAGVVATDWRRATDHLDAAAATEPGGLPPSLAAEAELLAAHVALGEHRADDAAERAERAHALAEAQQLDDLRCEAHELLGRSARVRDLDLAEACFRRELATAERAGMQLWQARALHELGTIDVFRIRQTDTLREAVQRAEAIGAPGLRAASGYHLALLHFLRHELAAAVDAATDAIVVADRFELGLLRSTARMVPGAVAAVRGMRPEAEARFADVMVGADVEIEAAARGNILGIAALAIEDRAASMAELEAAHRMAPADSAVAGSPFRGVRALLLALEGDPQQEEGLLRAENQVVAVTAAYERLAAAVAAGRSGDGDGAAAHAGAAFTALGPSPWFHHVALRLAAEAAIDDGWGDPARWLHEALGFFTAHGLDDLGRACRSLLPRAGAARAPGSVGGPQDDLPRRRGGAAITPREADVLALVAEGLTNKEIAARLYVSSRTVDKHVERLLMKTGAANRTQLAALVVGRPRT